MRMRTNTRARRTLTGGACLVLGLGAATNAAAQLQLRGSDTLEEVTKDAITAAGLGAQITYLGGGSGAGENAMVAGTQHVSPMSREIGAALKVCTVNHDWQELLIGLDGIALVTANQTGGDSLDATASVADDCSDSISGSATKTLAVAGCTINDGCSPDGSYTFASWQEVLAMVYGGQNHTAANGSTTFAAAGVACTYSIVQPNNETGGDAACPAGQVCFPNNHCGDPAVVGHRNPARINCLNPVRQALVDNWGFLFTDQGGTAACRTGGCTKLRHAFRRDDLSGTTDTFVGLVGLPTIANPTKAFINSPVANSTPIADRQAVANPFCNAGDRPLNKGDSDYLDLDPIRRAVDHLNSGGNRTGQEKVAELVPSFGGNNTDSACMTLVAGAPHIPQDRASPTAPGIWPDPDARRQVGATTTAELLTNDLGARFDQAGALAAPYAASTRLCLGLVLPVTLPANYLTTTQAYFGDPAAPTTTVLCTPGAFASVIADTRHSNALCPNGKSQAISGPCDMPVALNPDGTIKTFNCLSQQINPLPPGVQDTRVFNIHPVDAAGHYVVDNYINPNIPVAAGGINAVRQARIVSGYFRLHTTATTNKNGSVPTLAAGASCNTAFSSTEQIGCLVKANSCTVGFAGREAADDITLGPARNFAARIQGITASTANIQNLATGGTPVYPIARKLWFNSLVGFGSPLVTAPELALFNFENVPGNIDPIITARHFVTVPATDINGNPLQRLVSSGCP